MFLFIIIAFCVSFWLSKKYVNWRTGESLPLTQLIVLSAAVSAWTAVSLVVGCLVLLVGVEAFLLKNGTQRKKIEVKPETA